MSRDEYREIRPGEVMFEPTCPKCEGRPKMEPSTLQFILPEIDSDSAKQGKLELKVKDAGYPVAAYRCPRCRLILLYEE